MINDRFSKIDNSRINSKGSLARGGSFRSWTGTTGISEPVGLSIAAKRGGKNW